MVWQWDKLGQVFSPNGQYDWMQSHASTPTPEVRPNGLLRVYFTCRNASNQSHIGWADFDGARNFALEGLSEQPVVAPGTAGLFDDSGVAMGWLYTINHHRYLYYLGWNLKVTVPWQNTIGLAIARPGSDAFEKYSRAPIMDRSHEDPYSISYPCLLPAAGGGHRMWYGSNLGWGKDEASMQHVIKEAYSPDGIHWQRSHEVAVPLQYNNEYAIARPCVVPHQGAYHMWYTYRGRDAVSTYRIGYARSATGHAWQRLDDAANITVSTDPTAWDHQMVQYPYVFPYQGRWYMLYNGNHYGKTGFGIALAKH